MITNSLDPTEAIFPKLEVENIKFKQVNDVKIADPGRDYYVPFLVVHRYIAVDEDHPRAEVSPAYYKQLLLPGFIIKVLMIRLLRMQSKLFIGREQLPMMKLVGRFLKMECIQQSGQLIKIYLKQPQLR